MFQVNGWPYRITYQNTERLGLRFCNILVFQYSYANFTKRKRPFQICTNIGLQRVFNPKANELTKIHATLKQMSILLIAISTSAFLFVSWNKSKPDHYLSTLDAQFPIGEDTQAIVGELEKLGFDYTLYEYSYDRFRVISGTPAISPLPTFPGAPIELLDNCDESYCSLLRSSRLEYVYVFGFLRFHHTYRYLWIFRGDQLLGTSQNNGYWGFIL